MNNFTRYMIQIGQWKQTDKGIVQSGPYLSREKIKRVQGMGEETKEIIKRNN